MFLLLSTTCLASTDSLKQLSESHKSKMQALHQKFQQHNKAMADKLESLKKQLKEQFMQATNLEASIFMDTVLKGKAPTGKAPTEYTNLLASYEKSLKKTKLSYERALQSQFDTTQRAAQALIKKALKDNDLELAKRIKKFTDNLSLKPQALAPQSKPQKSPKRPPRESLVTTSPEEWILGTWKNDFGGLHTFNSDKTGSAYNTKSAKLAYRFKWEIKGQEINIIKKNFIYSKTGPNTLRVTGFPWANGPVDFTRTESPSTPSTGE